MILGYPKETKFHFIGISGIGMSGLAEILLSRGCIVSGSDLNQSELTEKLSTRGACIFQGHSASNVEDADVVIYSSAISHNNPEWIRATEKGLPRLKRGELLARILNQDWGVAIAGSHGKTTTTSLVSSILISAQKDPTFIIGGIVNHLGTNARNGSGKLVIAEADESDGSFLYLRPRMVALTNIDDDHLDHYLTRDKITAAFQDFVESLPKDGVLIFNQDDQGTLALTLPPSRKCYSYGLNQNADYRANDVESRADGTRFSVSFKGEYLGEVQTHLWGKHNVSNCLAAIALTHQLGLSFTEIETGIKTFTGVGRRLEKLWQKENFVVIDDYGHHPTEIRATIKALKEVDERPLCVVFEPHRYSRTKNFWEEFKRAFTGADEIYISPIYPASELAIPGVTSERLCEEMVSSGMKVIYLKDLSEMEGLVKKKFMGDEIFLTLGAGPISKKIRGIVKSL